MKAEEEQEAKVCQRTRNWAVDAVVVVVRECQRLFVKGKFGRMEEEMNLCVERRGKHFVTKQQSVHCAIVSGGGNEFFQGQISLTFLHPNRFIKMISFQKHKNGTKHIMNTNTTGGVDGICCSFFFFIRSFYGILHRKHAEPVENCCVCPAAPLELPEPCCVVAAPLARPNDSVVDGLRCGGVGTIGGIAAATAELAVVPFNVRVRGTENNAKMWR